MNLHHLLYFKTIAELENFTRASERLNVTQPNLSHAVRDLEEELEVKLFERQGRSVRLTRYGEIWLEYVDQALDSLEKGKLILSEYTHPQKGTVRMSYLSSLNQYVPWLTMKFYQSTEQIETKFEMTQYPTSKIEKDILDGKADLGISSVVDLPSISSFYLGNHETVLVVAENHPWAERRSVSLKELDGVPLITYTQECGIRKYIDGLFEAVEGGCHPKIVSEVMYDNLILGIVASGFGVGLIPKPLGYRPERVKILTISDSIPGRNLYMIWSSTRYISPATERFRDFVMEQALFLDQYMKEES